ncbi:MAG: AAA family ATPase [Nitrospirae bacterium]|nr:AAA family ATPase [Nitrospirota bacterium]
MFGNIKIHNFRGVSQLEIDDFRQVNLFVGKNNCGKSSVLEALFLNAGASNPDLPRRINKLIRKMDNVDEPSFRTLFNNFDYSKSIIINTGVKDSNESRELTITPSIAAREMAIPVSATSESIATNATGDDVNGLRLRFRLVDMEKHEKAIETRLLVKGINIQLESPSDFDFIDTLKGRLVSSDLSLAGLSEMFDKVQTEKKVDDILRVLQKIEPALKEIRLGKDGALMCDVGLPKLVPMNIMGDGIIKVLCIILAIVASSDGILLIDEVENGLHYSSLGIMWEAILHSAQELNVQVFATTHSYECIKAFCSSNGQMELGNEDNRRCYRIERKGEKFRVETYNAEEVCASIDSGWEVR